MADINFLDIRTRIGLSEDEAFKVVDGTRAVLVDTLFIEVDIDDDPWDDDEASCISGSGTLFRQNDGVLGARSSGEFMVPVADIPTDLLAALKETLRDRMRNAFLAQPDAVAASE